MSKPIPKGTPVEGDVTEGRDNRFLNALVLQSALEKSGKGFLPVTIDRIEHHDVLRYETGQTDQNADLVYFRKSDKPLKLNTTNRNMIVRLHGPLGKGWHGKKVALGLGTARNPGLGGALAHCVRVLYLDPDTGKPPVVQPIDPFAK